MDTETLIDKTLIDSCKLNVRVASATAAVRISGMRASAVDAPTAQLGGTE